MQSQLVKPIKYYIPQHRITQVFYARQHSNADARY